MKFITLKIALLASLISAAVLFGSSSVSGDTGDIAIIVSRDSPLDTISEREVRRLFLGKSIKLPNGSRATLAIYEPLKTEFNTQALRRTDAQVSAAWSRLKFSGRNSEPEKFSDLGALMNFVATTPNAVAYGVSDADRQDIKEILTIQ